ncbi:MAG TPA: carbohydrate kinase family protein [Candidatus Acidoferrales bacterium]
MPSANLRILVLGDINLDIFGRGDGILRRGCDNLSPVLELHCGGVGANLAIALSRWGIPVELAGCVGRDIFGDYVMSRLACFPIDLSSVEKTSQAATGLFFISVGRNGERTFFGSRGANGWSNQLRGSPRLPGRTALFLTVGYSFLAFRSRKRAQRMMDGLRRKKVPIALDVGEAASHRPEVLRAALPKVNILFSTEKEASALTGTRRPEEAARKLLRRGPHIVVLKLGAKGCRVIRRQDVLRVPACRVDAVDTTGCGDAFDAAFMQAMLRGCSLEEAGLLANACGAAAARVLGAGERLPGPRETWKILERARFRPPWEATRRSLLKWIKTLDGGRHVGANGRSPLQPSEDER